MDFNKYRGLLIECISDCLPAETIPKRFNQNMSDIINFINSIEKAINENVLLSMESPIIHTLNNDEKLIWMQKMKEKARIQLLNDVSEKEYTNFVNQLKECIKQWSSWGWTLPQLDNYDYNVDISIDNIHYEEMTEENFINWLLLNWLSTKPSTIDGKNCISICIRTWFYPIITSKLDTNIIKQVIDVYNKYEYITSMFPKEWEWKKESQRNIVLYIKHRVDDLFKKNQDITKSFIDLVEKLLEFQDAWNIVFNEYELSLNDLTAEYVSKYIIPYFANNLKNIEQNIVNSRTLDEHIDDKILGTIKGSIHLVYRLDTSHNILRLLHIYTKYIPNILKSIYGKRQWIINIDKLETWIESFNNIIIYLSNKYSNELIISEILSFNEKIDWDSIIAFVLDESIEWKKLLDNKSYQDMHNIFIEWSNDKTKKKYLRRLIQVWIHARLDKTFNTLKKDKIEGELRTLGEFKNSLIELEESETWIEPLELFLCKWLNYIKDNSDIKYRNGFDMHDVFDMINFSKINKANKMLHNSLAKIKKII